MISLAEWKFNSRESQFQSQSRLFSANESLMGKDQVFNQSSEKRSKIFFVVFSGLILEMSSTMEKYEDAAETCEKWRIRFSE